MKRMHFDCKFNRHRQPPTGERGRESLKSARSCFSFAAYARNVIEHLTKCGVPIARGLSDEELSEVEGLFGFVFPPDVRSILHEGLPVGNGFPNWRSCTTKWEEEERVRTMMDLPMAALSYDVAVGKFWCKAWGPRPSNVQQAFHMAAVGLSKTPTLIPIYTHCYISSSPCLVGNPLLLLRRGDFYYCGYDVFHFFYQHTFSPRDISISPQPRSTLSRRPITPVVWSKFMNIDDDSHADYSNRCRCIWELERQYLLGEKPRAHDIISALNLNRKTVPVSVLARCRMKAAFWTAQSGRRIEFWSDIFEKRHTMNVAPHSTCSRVRCQGLAVINNNDSHWNNDLRINRKWVANYLKVIEQKLRNGGWKDQDIFDIINPESCSFRDQSIRIGLSDQNERELLGHRVEIWSSCLRKGGWSDRDIVECFS